MVIVYGANTKATGLLKHYMLEIKKDVFVGNVNTKVRQTLEMQLGRMHQSAAFIYDSNGLQELSVDTIGNCHVAKYFNLTLGVKSE